jgi:hypothetical protein
MNQPPKNHLVRLSLLHQLYTDRFSLKVLLFRYGLLMGLLTLVLGFVLTYVVAVFFQRATSYQDILGIFIILQVPLYLFLHTLFLALPVYRVMIRTVDPTLVMLLITFLTLVWIALMSPLLHYAAIWMPYAGLALPVMLLPLGSLLLALHFIKTPCLPDRRTTKEDNPPAV